MRACAFLLLLLSYRAAAQTQLARIFEENRKAGTVAVFAENMGFVPLTIHLRAELNNMTSTPALPTRAVVLPGAVPQLLAIFAPGRGPNYSYQYYPAVSLGIADGKALDSTYVYGLPFGPEVAWQWLPTNPATDKVPPDSYPYFFTLPGNSPVCAARAGIVAQLHQKLKYNNRPKSNFIIVYHDDGSYGWYQNLKQNGAVVKLGQRVAKGELLGYSSAEKKPLPLWFTLLYPGEITEKEVPVRFEGITNYGGFRSR